MTISLRLILTINSTRYEIFVKINLGIFNQDNIHIRNN